MKIILFWMGDQSKITPLKEALKKTGNDIEVGPSDKEHRFLMENVPYYRESFSIKSYAFCSDVWRVWKLSKEEALYIDASVSIGENFNEFIEEVRKYNGYFVRENFNIVANSVMASTEKSFPIFVKLYELYMSLGNDPRTHYIGPFLLTQTLVDDFGFSRSWDDEENGGVKLSGLMTIRDKKTIFKTGFGSWWGNSNNEGADLWLNQEKKWISRDKMFDKKTKNLIVWGLRATDPTGARALYEQATTKEQRKQALKLYKQLQYRPPFLEKMIWSKMWAFFNNRLK